MQKTFLAPFYPPVLKWVWLESHYQYEPHYTVYQGTLCQNFRRIGIIELIVKKHCVYRQKTLTTYSGTYLNQHTKWPGKSVGLYRMSEYSGYILVNKKYFGNLNFCRMSQDVGRLRRWIVHVVNGNFSCKIKAITIIWHKCFGNV